MCPGPLIEGREHAGRWITHTALDHSSNRAAVFAKLEFLLLPAAPDGAETLTQSNASSTPPPLFFCSKKSTAFQEKVCQDRFCFFQQKAAMLASDRAICQQINRARKAFISALINDWTVTALKPPTKHSRDPPHAETPTAQDPDGVVWYQVQRAVKLWSGSIFISKKDEKKNISMKECMCQEYGEYRTKSQTLLVGSFVLNL